MVFDRYPGMTGGRNLNCCLAIGLVFHCPDFIQILIFTFTRLALKSPIMFIVYAAGIN